MRSSFQARAAQYDDRDELASWRTAFLIPQFQGKDSIYFTGNSLGLQPKSLRALVNEELDDWAEFGVEGHFHSRRPWYSYHEQLMQSGAEVVGAKLGEVVHMNGLTVNLHLMMVSFYQPTESRFKIICEAKAFPSDQYMLESQLAFHGLSLDEALIEVAPRVGEHLIRHEDILKAIADCGDQLAMVFWGGMNYYSGQFFDIEAITRAAHAAGAVAGFDLAHAAGNVPLALHDWNVDWAAWCTYKYLNSSPGGVSGVFVHQRHASNPDLLRFAGWWGHNKESRFQMEPGFDALPTAEGWQLSNAPILSMAAHLASLRIFEEVGMENLRAKSLALTAFLEEWILAVAHERKANIEVITPSNPNERGCQLSLLVHGYGKPLFDAIAARGVIADWRNPNVIRIAPVPLYNSFQDCFRFGEILFEELGNKL